MKTKLNELLEFPCSFTYKVMGAAEPELVNDVLEVIQRHAPVTTVRQSNQAAKEPIIPFLSPLMRHTLSRSRICTKN